MVITEVQNNGRVREEKINSDFIRRFFKEEMAFKRVFERRQESKHIVMLQFLSLAMMKLLALNFSGPPPH